MSGEDMSPIKRALVEQRKLKARIAELEGRRSEAIAVIGIGCRFPGGADSPEAFWNLLMGGVDAIREWPAERFDAAALYDPDPEAPGKSATRFGGFLSQVDRFDAHYFGISPREAVSMDPQQRLLLEVSWEALEHAGHAPDRIAGTATGVFVGIGTNDYLQLLAQQTPLDGIDAYLATGNAHSVASGRLAYLLGTHGPALSVDTACSSSLVAVHLACESIRAGRCDTALAGGVGVLLSPENYVSLSKARMMAPDGRCKAFDAAADGFVRAEGCGMVVLKRLSLAQAAGDRILAVIRGTACNQDGRSNGITAPNGPAQQNVLRAALADAGVAPRDIGYVEAHGTGTSLGDPIEVEALGAVLGRDRSPETSLHLGSVKTNLGHLEAAAGIAGLIKTVLALHHGTIPATLHFKLPNPHIEWSQHPYLRIPQEAVAWRGARRFAGVSAFGFSGTNAHVVLGNAEEGTADDAPAIRAGEILAVSARTPAMLRDAAAELARHLGQQARPDDARFLADWCHSINTGRPTHPLRRAFVAATPREMQAQLDAFVQTASAAVPDPADLPSGLLFRFPASRPEPAQLAALCAAEPQFRKAWTACGSATERWPAFAAGIALADLWSSWGIRANSVTGDGEGELAAAVVAGALGREDALRLLDGSAEAAISPVEPELPMYCATRGTRLGRSDLAPRFARLASSGGSPRPATGAPGRSAESGSRGVLDLRIAADPGLLEQLKQLYEAGHSIDWRGFGEGRGCKRIDVPFSPYQRERYWFDVPEQSAPDDGWQAVIHAASEHTRLPAEGPGPAVFADLWSELDALTTHAVARALTSLGLFTVAGEALPMDAAFRASGMLPMYRTLFGHWIARLCRAGWLQQSGDQVKAVGGVGSLPARPVLRHLKRWPVFEAYLGRAEESLAAIAVGRSSPLQVLFPEGSLEASAFFYRDWELARYFNSIVAAAAEAIARRAPSRSLRVLEIGAGTGGTTSAVLPRLREAAAEYWFTDLSDHFAARAETYRAEFPFVRFARFDLEDEPADQNIPLGYFDLIIAANSVHATRDIGLAVERAKAVLAPGGTLVLYEVTRDFDWFEMSWALVEGWQRFADPLRPSSPLLPTARWRELLGRSGFSRCEIFPPAGDAAEALGHHVIVASVGPSVGKARGARIPTVPVMSADVAPQPVASPVEASVDWRSELAAVTPGERQQRLQHLVRQNIVRVMHLEDPAKAPGIHDRLMNAGLDSLMAVELRNGLRRALGSSVKVPATLIFDYPTIASIASLLHDLLGLTQPAAAAAEPIQAAPVPPATLTDAASLASLSDKDAEALLLEKLKVLM